MTLDDNDESALVDTCDGFPFIADDDVKKMIQLRGGVEIDFVDSFFGGRLEVRFKTGSCSC